MNARPGAALACGVLALALACQRDPPPPPARDGRGERQQERERILAFWRELHAASQARLRRDCATAASGYERALALDPRHEDALYYLGQCRRATGRPAEARVARRHWPR